MKRNLIKNIAILSLIAFTVIGCKKYNNPESKFEDYEVKEEKTVSRKVLVISIDGLVGQEIKKKIPTNIAALMKNSKYSFDALTDVKTSDASSWTTLATGYSSISHNIESDNYLPTPNGNNPHGEINFVPTVIYRLENLNPSTKTSAVVQDVGLANTLLADADNNILVNSDEKVKNETISLFSKVSSDFCIIQFKDVLKAGIASGFSMSETNYAAAVEKVDTYIGEILSALRKRENYAYEDWLIVVTSNHGGVGKDYGGDSFAERNVFTLYYQKDLVEKELVPEIIVSPHFYGFDGSESGPKEGVRARNAVAASEESNYNFATTGQLTVEAKIKINKNANNTWSYSHPPFLSKADRRSGDTPGWSFFRTGNGLAFWCADGSTNMSANSSSVSINDQWAHITGTIQNSGGMVSVKLYVDGLLVGENTKAMNVSAMLSNSPLTFGYQSYVFSGGFVDMHIADVHIWNTVLSDDQIRENAKRVGVAENHPKTANLVGNWQMNDGEAVLKNKVVGMPDIPLNGPYQYKVLGNNLPYVDDSTILVQNVDVASQAFYWLGVKPNDSWKLEGSAFLSKFELEFLK